jgi:predicted Rossmann-fold nucleotide-binding protein
VSDAVDGVAPAPSALYSADDLYGSWRPDDPASAADTFDLRTYRTARAHGLRVPPTLAVAHARADHDTTVSWLLNEALEGAHVVAVMGGHAMARDDVAYGMVAALAHRLAAAGATIVTGGGPGAMEAAHLGARLAGGPLPLADGLRVVGHRAAEAEPTAGLEADEHQRRRDALAFPFHSADELFTPDGDLVEEAVARLHRWQAPAFALAAATAGTAGPSIGIPTWLHGHEPPTPLATHHAKYYDNSIREDGLLTVARGGVVFAPGRAGTLQEVFQDAAQNYYARGDERFNPMVFLDVDGHWSRDYPIRAVLERLLTEEQEANLHWVTTVDDAVAALTP